MTTFRVRTRIARGKRRGEIETVEVDADSHTAQSNEQKRSTPIVFTKGRKRVATFKAGEIVAISRDPEGAA